MSPRNWIDKDVGLSKGTATLEFRFVQGFPVRLTEE
jgi:hypothetical protein